MKRPPSINILAGYLLVVFGVSIMFNVFGAFQQTPPYSSNEWLLLALPKVFAFGAGIAFLKMLKFGAFLWAIAIISGWAIAAALGTGMFPNIGVASLISLIVIALSAWVIVMNWKLLRPTRADAVSSGVAGR